MLWTVVTTSEYPPDDMDAFRRMKREKGGLVHGLTEIWSAVREMPRTMKELTVVQFFTWFALPCMWQFFGLTVARHVFGAPDQTSPQFAAGVEWAALCFAVYNIACFAVAFLLPKVADLTSRKGVHILCLAIGGLGLLSVGLAANKYSLWLSMTAVGIAWASILSMPYVLLAGAIRQTGWASTWASSTCSSSSRRR